jgi:hypothetical protein
VPEDTRKLCVNCAWRANCAKRFSFDSGATLHCPDYCEDVLLRKERATPSRGDADGEQSQS